jgi:rhodanese family protein
MTISIISALEAKDKLAAGALLIDIRQPEEYRREHIEGSVLQPLSELQRQGLNETLKQGSCLIFHCKSGARTCSQSEFFKQLAQESHCEVYLLEDGINGWKNAGLATKFNPSQPIDIMRQVQIVAGSLILLGSLLGWSVSPYFYWLPAFVGAGLTFAGISGFCGMAKLLARMPWNRK